ncbi:hypothetical protein DB346_10670 [Verrucomicrobia bacterium LW23]|nr:hypothetical protein DB346_10670 [Verrucomicrobia bacterium LW23]
MHDMKILSLGTRAAWAAAAALVIAALTLAMAPQGLLAEDDSEAEASPPRTRKASMPTPANAPEAREKSTAPAVPTAPVASTAPATRPAKKKGAEKSAASTTEATRPAGGGGSGESKAPAASGTGTASQKKARSTSGSGGASGTGSGTAGGPPAVILPQMIFSSRDMNSPIAAGHAPAPVAPEKQRTRTTPPQRQQQQAEIPTAPVVAEGNPTGKPRTSAKPAPQMPVEKPAEKSATTAKATPAPAAPESPDSAAAPSIDRSAR